MSGSFEDSKVKMQVFDGYTRTKRVSAIKTTDTNTISDIKTPLISGQNSPTGTCSGQEKTLKNIRQEHGRPKHTPGNRICPSK